MIKLLCSLRQKKKDPLLYIEVFLYISYTVMRRLTMGIRSEKCVVVRTSYSVQTQT